MKEDVRYILKHKRNGLYLMDKNGHEFTTNRSSAREWKVNNKPDEEYWASLMKGNDYTVIRRIETVTVEYKEVEME